MLITTINWASAQVIGKMALSKIDVLTFNAVRASTVLPLAILFVIFTGELMNPRLEFLLPAIISGIIGRFVAVQLFFYLMKKNLAHRVMSISNSYPLWSVILAVLLLGEQPSVVVLVAAVLIVVGAYFLSSKGGESGSWNLFGAAMAFLVAIMWGSLIVINKYCLGGMSAGTLLLLVNATGAAACTSVVIPRVRNSPELDRRSVGLAMLSGILGLFVGEILSYFALRMEKASVLSPVLGTLIPFGFLLTVFLLKERPSRRAYFGMVIIFLSVVLVSI
jgi:drug/metabolite transporter (DMT)-like permease